MAENRTYTKWWARSAQRFAGTKLGAWLLLNVGTYTDPVLFKLTNGKLSSGPLGGISVCVLTTRGAKSGLERSVPLMYFQDGSNIILIASHGGSPRHPGWYYNLKANPEAWILLPGDGYSFVAREATGEERERLWKQAIELHIGLMRYEDRVGERQIPVMVLEAKDNYIPD